MNFFALRPFAGFMVIAAALCLASFSAGAGQNLVKCPFWWVDGFPNNWPTPEMAQEKAFHYTYPLCDANISCSEPYSNPTFYNCTITYPQNNVCPPIPNFTTNPPKYSPTYGYAGVANGTDNRAHCVNETPEDTKNNGDCKNCRGNPVNFSTGNKYQRETDLPSVGPDGLEFVRFYNAHGGGASQIGLNWTHTYSRTVYLGDPSDARANRQDGKILSFVLSGGVWVGDPDNPETLQAAGSGFILKTRNDDTETYDARGHLLSIVNRAGLTTTLAYSDGTASPPSGQACEGSTLPVAQGSLLKVTDPFGRTLTFGYDVNGHLVRMTDPAGAIYRYTYGDVNGSGNLASVQYPDSFTRTYVYDESANVSGWTYLYTALTGIVDENNARFATFKYEPGGNAIDTEHAGGVEAWTFSYSPASFTSPLGANFPFASTQVQGVNLITSITQNCPGCGGTSAESYTYDVNGNVASRKDYNGNLTCYAYDITRNLETSRTEGLSGAGTCASRVTTPATRTITTEWHPTWRIPKRIAEPLKITTFTYNGDSGVSCAPAGTSIATVCSKTVQATTDHDGSQAFAGAADGAARAWSYAYNSLAQVLTMDGPRTDVADVTTYAYYPSGDRLSVVNALGQTTQFTQYDGDGRLLKMIDPNGMETILTYAPRGWLASRTIGTVAAGYETTTYDYDNLGQLKKVTQPDLSFVAYTYDDAHRLTTIQDGLANKISYTLDAAGNRIAEQSFDTTGALVRAHSRVIDVLNRLAKDIGGTSPGTQITQYAYDGNGNVTTITDPLSRITTQIYDARDRLVEVRDPFNGSAAPTKYEYDARDQLTKVTDPASLATTYTLNGHGDLLAQASPDTGNTVFTDDLASNVITKLDARGVQATYSYDALNRVTQITYPDETVVYTYDSCANGVGRLCTVADASGSTSYSYDVKGRVSAKAEVVGTVTLTTGYAYNAAGQLATVTTPGGRSVTYGYSNNRPVSVAVDGQAVLSSVFYEPFGPNGGWQWGNSAPGAVNTHTRVFDKDFRTTRITSDLPASGPQPYFDRQLTWDVQGRVQALSDLSNAALNATYGYDALDRLTSEAQSATNTSFTYSGVGDRLTSIVNGASSTYAYAPASHRLQQATGAQPRSFTFDAAGNVTGDGTKTWTFGGNGRNKQVVSGAVITSYAVNALGQRVSKIDSAGNKTFFAYDERGRLIGEYDGAGHPITETIWLEDLPVAAVR